MAKGDRDFKESQRWILKHVLGREQSRWERLKIRIKFRVVQAHALYRAVQKYLRQ